MFKSSEIQEMFHCQVIFLKKTHLGLPAGSASEKTASILAKQKGIRELQMDTPWRFTTVNDCFMMVNDADIMTVIDGSC